MEALNVEAEYARFVLDALDPSGDLPGALLPEYAAVSNAEEYTALQLRKGNWTEDDGDYYDRDEWLNEVLLPNDEDPDAYYKHHFED